MHPSQLSLWTLVERLQRRLERQGLRGAALDAAVATAMYSALRRA